MELTREFLEAQLASFKDQRQEAFGVLNRCEAGVQIMEALLAKLGEPEPAPD